MTKLHIIYIPFKDVGVGTPFRSEEWFLYRIKIFTEYTLRSLMNQSNKDFMLWLSFTPKDKGTPFIELLATILNRAGMKYVFTYDGLMYHDDKFGGNLWHRTKNFLRIVRRVVRSKRLKDFNPLVKQWLKNENKNKSLYVRVTYSLMEMNNLVDSTKYDWVYMTRLDSDDMLASHVVHDIQGIEPDYGGSILMKQGFVYNKNTDELSTWGPSTNPPFHTIMFPSDKFFNARKYVDYYRNFKSHEDIPYLFPPTYLRNGSYMVLVHSLENQISTIWEHPFRNKNKITGNNKRRILNKFGLG